MTAHRHELGRWAAPAKIVAFPLGVLLITVWGVGLVIVTIVAAPLRFLQWIATGQPGWDDAVGGPAIDDDLPDTHGLERKSPTLASAATHGSGSNENGG